MATSPSPDSQPSAVPPPPRLSTPATPPPWSSTRFSSPPSPPPEANSPSTMSNSSANSTAPPPSTESPPAQPPEESPPPLATPSPPPDSSSPSPESAPPPAPVSPLPIPSPATNSPPLPPSPSPSPSPNPPVNPQPTPTPSPSADSPPSPSSNPPSVSPPPRTDPPRSSPPPSPTPSQNSPPSPSSQPPQTTTPPADSPPQNSPPAPLSSPPTNATPPSTFSTPPPLAPNSQLSPNSSARPVFPVSPPPSGPSPPSLVPPSPSQVQVPPSGIPTVNNSIPNAPSGNGGIGTGVAVAVGAVLGFILLSVIGAAVSYTRKQKKKVSGMPTLLTSPNTDSSLLKGHRSPIDVESRTPSEYLFSPSTPGGLGDSRPWFTYEALVEATNGFSAENLLGEGGFGSVYKGYLPDGQEVAVKQLKIGGGQGEREFKAEVEIISRIHHRHLVSLAGYCISDNRRLLVYEFVPNNTLHFHLHGAERPVMTWETRVRVAAGAARGIAYLHEDCHPRIIHRDIKSANILLDNNFEARVSDFGLAKLAVDANSHVTTRVMGTFGYMAPEYASSGKLTEKSDVFSFGVVLLELITGRKPVDTSLPLGEESLVEWARPQLSHALATKQFEDLIDPRLEKNYVNSEMFRVIEAAAACVRHSATKRPSMGQVVRAFDSLITADLSNGMRVGESAIYNFAEQSAEIRLFQRMAFGAQDYSSDFFSHGSWHS